MRRFVYLVRLWWRTRTLRRVLRRGTVRDLERLEECYRTVGLPSVVEYLRHRTRGDYARFVLERESPVWGLDHDD